MEQEKESALQKEIEITTPKIKKEKTLKIRSTPSGKTSDQEDIDEEDDRNRKKREAKRLAKKEKEKRKRKRRKRN